MLIPIVIPTGYTYSCSVSGTTFKIVQCEHCRFIYVYKMMRSASSAVSTSLLNENPYGGQQAEAAAFGELTQKLRDDCDGVPCLECGKYQQHMIDALKRDFQLGLRAMCRLAFGGAALGGIFALISLL